MLNHDVKQPSPCLDVGQMLHSPMKALINLIRGSTTMQRMRWMKPVDLNIPVNRYGHAGTITSDFEGLYPTLR